MPRLWSALGMGSLGFVIVSSICWFAVSSNFYTRAMGYATWADMDERRRRRTRTVCVGLIVLATAALACEGAAFPSLPKHQGSLIGERWTHSTRPFHSLTAA